MSQIKGPALFLAQFMGDEPPFDSLEHITAWAKELGFVGVQVPTFDPRCIDLDKAAESKGYCDELKGKCNGLAITELASHLQGQLVAVHPAFDVMFDAFAAESVRGNPQARTEWAVDQVIKTIKASANLGLSVMPTFSGALLWPYLYPWPQRPAGLVDMGFKELASRWKPILAAADKHGVDLAYELHPGEDLHDGVTFERFLEATGNHPRVAINYDPSHFVLQCMDYVGFIYKYADRIKAFHVKDAEYRESCTSGVYSGYQDWKDRPGRFRSAGDGEVDFTQVFTALTETGYSSWAVLEWECCVKDASQGAAEGAQLIAEMLIDTPTRAFDDFADTGADEQANRKILGL
ncbi:MAG: TIM barrel protein [Chitinivibrionales bacterium]|nr:TIM barrel protein [Chitinivibrionales bacterium]